MKNKITILTMALLSLALVSNAQTHVFKVLSSQGMTEIKRGNKWTAITRGTKVFEGSKLRIKENGYIGIVHKSGKLIQLKKEGEYDVNTLASKINVRSSSFANKYGSYIASKMSGSSSTSKSSAHMLGAVDRGTIPEDLAVLVSEDSHIRQTPTVIKWKTKEEGPYEVLLINLFDEVIFKTTTNDKQIELNLSGKEIEGDICLLKVIPVKNPNALAYKRKLEIISGSKAVEISNELSEIESELDLNNALDNFFYATYFEDKGLNLEALHYYEQAMKMEPQVEDYKNAYNEFIVRQNIKVKE